MVLNKISFSSSLRRGIHEYLCYLRNVILSINPSHDASIAWFDENGQVTHAISEERLTRRKHDFVFPRKSLSWLNSEVDLSRTRMVLISGISNYESIDFEILAWMFREESYVGFDGQRNYRFPPGLPVTIEKGKVWDFFRELLLKELSPFGIKAEIIFQNHHECHAWSAIVPSGYSDGLALTLDGEGDAESGTLWKFKRLHDSYSVEKLKSFSVKNSLGYFYSAVTGRYNMKRYSHEGKITGLSAQGHEGPSLSYLRKKVRCIDGSPHIRIAESKVLKGVSFVASYMGFSSIFPYSHTALADEAANKSESFAELAYSAQHILEQVIVEMLSDIHARHGGQNLVLAGGVFSNVKLNQVIAESGLVDQVYVYPNMGDGGLPIGGGYKFFSEQRKLPTSSNFNFIPYVGSDLERLNQNFGQDSRFVVEKFAEDEWITKIVDSLSRQHILGFIQGRMEFGPRALMNRSILASATNANINTDLNKRLRRTEYMPFAPVIRMENLSKVFEVSKIKDLRNFEFMTMTCGVKSEYSQSMPAVVHVDGTARPQVVSEKNNYLAWRILKCYEEKTGIPCLINTSFNAHEEPIVESVTDITNSLMTNVIDMVAYPFSFVKVK